MHCWGSNEGFAFGMPEERVYPMVKVLEGAGWIQIYVGSGHTCALHESGRLECVGVNSSGIAARGDAYDVLPEFAPIDSQPFVVQSISAEFNHICAFSEKEEAYCWGSNSYGELGFGHQDAVLRPSRAPHFDHRRLQFGRLAAYVFEDGQNKVAGRNDVDMEVFFHGRGRLGQGHVDNVIEFSRLCVE